MSARGQQYLLICNTSDGLIAQLNGVIIQLQFARRLGLTPIIYLHERSYMFGGPNPYFDAEQGANVWDYYFEPIGASGPELDKLVSEGRVATLSTASELERLFRWEPQSYFMNPFGYYRSVENTADGTYPEVWWETQRRRARPFLIDGPIRLSSPIMDQVNAFEAAKFSKKTLGLQLRGSDKFDFGVGPNLSRKIEPEEYFPHIDSYLTENPDCDRIFVATDQRQWLKELEAAYPDHVISYAQMSLSESGENMFNQEEEKAARGAEVLVDMMLLSRCQYILKCHAAVGEMALVMAPQVPFKDLNYLDQPARAKRAFVRPFAAATIEFLVTLWAALARRGLALETVRSIEGSDITVGRRRGRPLNTKPNATDNAPRPPLFSARFLSDGFEWSLRKLGSLCYRYESLEKS